MSLYNSQIPAWWEANITGTAMYGNADLASRLWIAASCQHKNAQQIASMPIVFSGIDEPAWVSNPDPNMFPNGIGDAMYSIVDQMYGWGFVCLYITAKYANGFPRSWTILESQNVHIDVKSGSRTYKYGEHPLDASLIVQIDRNPGLRAHGTSAIRAFAQLGWGLMAAGNQSMTTSQGGIPQAVLKSERKLTKEQAEALQTQWMDSTTRRNGAPPILPPELDFEVLSINPSDLALIETQQWDAMMICNAYGMPSVLQNMALAGGLTYQNPAALGEFWWRFELRNVSTRISNAFSAQMLPRGQSVSLDASDTFAEITDNNDTQASQAAKASPAQQPQRLTAIGGSG